MRKFYTILSVFFWLLSIGLMAQNAPVVTIGTVSSYESTAIVPITASNFSNISSCNLELVYDSTIRAVSIATSRELGGSLNSDLSVPGRISLGWFITPGISLPGNPVLFNITFEKVTRGTSGLRWMDNGYSCVFYDENFNPLNDIPTVSYYINGSLTFLPTAGLIEIQAKVNSLHLSASPNPFTGSATLSYFVPRKGHVIIEVLNMTGERITTIVDETEQGGDHSLKLSTGCPRPGIYTVRIILNTNNRIMSQCIKIICI
jgi:hypothetical protein